MVEAAGLVLGAALMGSLLTEVGVSKPAASLGRFAHGVPDARGSSIADSAQGGTETPTTVALEFFADLPRGDVGVALRAVRPPRISVAERARVLATLPEEGELAPDRGERRKLASLDRVLKYHDRADLDIKVVDLPHAGVIYYQAVLLISRPVLRLLSAEELQAAVAHEIGHEYFWAEQQDPRRATNRQTLELKCDGIALLTLLALGLDASRLISAMTKIIEFNHVLGVTTDTTGYPTVRERDAFARSLVKLERDLFRKHRNAELP